MPHIYVYLVTYIFSCRLIPLLRQVHYIRKPIFSSMLGIYDMFSWFSSLVHEVAAGAPSAPVITNQERPSTPPPRPNRMIFVNEHTNVFAFKNLGKGLIGLI
jgi:hypothetical protein